MGDLEVSANLSNESILVIPRGEVDMATAGTLERAIDAIDEPCPEVVLDLRRVSLLDSSGLAVLARLSRHGIRVVVRNPAEIVRKALAISGVDELLVIE